MLRRFMLLALTLSLLAGMAHANEFITVDQQHKNISIYQNPVGHETDGPWNAFHLMVASTNPSMRAWYSSLSDAQKGMLQNIVRFLRQQNLQEANRYWVQFLTSLTNSTHTFSADEILRELLRRGLLNPTTQLYAATSQYGFYEQLFRQYTNHLNQLSSETSVRMAPDEGGGGPGAANPSQGFMQTLQQELGMVQQKKTQAETNLHNTLNHEDNQKVVKQYESAANVLFNSAVNYLTSGRMNTGSPPAEWEY